MSTFRQVFEKRRQWHAEQAALPKPQFGRNYHLIGLSELNSVLHAAKDDEVSTQPVDLADLQDWIGVNLPPEWTFIIRVTSTEANLYLFDRDSYEHHVDHDDLTTLEAVVADVNFARKKAHLDPVSYPGLAE